VCVCVCVCVCVVCVCVWCVWCVFYVTHNGCVSHCNRDVKRKELKEIDKLHLSSLPVFGEDKFIIYPNHKFRRTWDICIALVVIYLCVTVPLDVGFEVPYQKESTTKAFNYILDSLFWVDMLFNFRTAFVHDGHLETGSKAIAWHYIHTWFVLDFVGSFPFELTDAGLDKTQRKSIKLWKIIKLAKLFRIGRLVKIFKNFVKFRFLFLVMCIIVFLTHWMTCVWAWALSADSVVATSLDIYLTLCNDVLSHMLKIQGLVAKDDAQRAISILLNILGGCWLAALTGVFVSLVQSSRNLQMMFRQKMDSVTEEMQRLGLSRKLQTRVLHYYDYLWFNNKSNLFGSETLYKSSELSVYLKKKVTDELLVGAFPLKKIAMLKDCSDDCLAAILHQMQIHVFMPRDYVCKKGEVGKELYYCIKGVVEVLVPKENKDSENLKEKEVHVTVADEDEIEFGIVDALGDVKKKAHHSEGVEEDDEHLISVAQMTAGTSFGELALLTDTRRTASIRAVTCVELVVLTKTALQNVFEDHPEFEHILHNIALERLEADRLRQQGENEKGPKNNGRPSTRDGMEKSIRMSRSMTSKKMKDVGAYIPGAVPETEEIRPREASVATLWTSGNSKGKSRDQSTRSVSRVGATAGKNFGGGDFGLKALLEQQSSQLEQAINKIGDRISSIEADQSTILSRLGTLETLVKSNSKSS